MTDGTPELTEYARVLWTSPRYTVFHEWETTMVAGAPPRHLVVAYMYADPAAAAIDPSGEWCVTVGAGLVAYRLGPPWIPYCRPGASGALRDPYPAAIEAGQWFEWGTDGPDRATVWLDTVEPLGPGRFRVTEDPAEPQPRSFIFALSPSGLTVRTSG